MPDALPAPTYLLLTTYCSLCLLRYRRLERRVWLLTIYYVLLRGVVIGGTAIVGNDIYMLHTVTLGATGKPTYGAKRHPTIGSRVVLGAGSTVLGDITVGDGSTVGAAAIVTRDVPEVKMR